MFDIIYLINAHIIKSFLCLVVVAKVLRSCWLQKFSGRMVRFVFYIPGDGERSVNCTEVQRSNSIKINVIILSRGVNPYGALRARAPPIIWVVGPNHRLGPTNIVTVSDNIGGAQSMVVCPVNVLVW